MEWLRSRWGMRILAIWLGFSLVPVAAAPVVQAMQPSRAPLYAAWLRENLEEAALPYVEAAIARAAEGRARSLESFVKDFARAFEDEHPRVALAEVFPLEESSTEALVRYLYARYGQVLGGVPVVNATLEAKPHHLAGTQGRVAAILPSADDVHVAAAPSISTPTSESQYLAFPVRQSWSARPQGP